MLLNLPSDFKIWMMDWKPLAYSVQTHQAPSKDNRPEPERRQREESSKFVSKKWVQVETLQKGETAKYKLKGTPKLGKLSPRDLKDVKCGIYNPLPPPNKKTKHNPQTNNKNQTKNWGTS